MAQRKVIPGEQEDFEAETERIGVKVNTDLPSCRDDEAELYSFLLVTRIVTMAVILGLNFRGKCVLRRWLST